MFDFAKWFRKVFHTDPVTAGRVRGRRPASSRRNRTQLSLEALEDRTLLYASPQVGWLSPAAVAQRYGFDNIQFPIGGGPLIQGDGSGQTIAIIAASANPTYFPINSLLRNNVVTDLRTFDTQFGLVQMDGQNGDPTLTRYAQDSSGATTFHAVTKNSVAQSRGLPVLGASNTSPIVITTGSTAGMSTGDQVTINGVKGNTAANNTWTITLNNDGTSFQLNNSAGNGNYVSGGIIIDPNLTPALELEADVQWAHALAPGANIMLVGATDYTLPNIAAAAQWAASQPGVSVVSMSLSAGVEGLNPIDHATYDSAFSHPGVTFVASAGDTTYWTDSNGNQQPWIEYPAELPNVLAVGGTALQNPNDTTSTEVVWNNPPGSNNNLPTGSTSGGASPTVPVPAWQQDILPPGSSGLTGRGVPDVAYLATTYAVVDSFDYNGNSPWISFGGTSAGAPQWAALMAIVNQGRAVEMPDRGTLNGINPTVPMLYALPSTDFNDITQGGNGLYNAGFGWDLVTGLGTPHADLIAGDLTNPHESQVVNGTLIVNSTQDGDAVSVGSQWGYLALTVNGQVELFDPSALNGITINTSGNGSSVEIDQLPVALGVTVNASGAGDTITVRGANGLVTIYDAGSSTIQVLSETGGVDVYGTAATQVTVGNGSLGGIQGDVTVGLLPQALDPSPVTSPVSLTVDDSRDGTSPQANLNGVSLFNVPVEELTGLAQANINYLANSVAATIDLGSGTLTVNSTGAPDTIINATGANVNVLGTSGGMTVHATGGSTVLVGEGSLAGINGPVTADSADASATLVVDDSNDTAAHPTAALQQTTLFGLPIPGGVTVSNLALANLYYQGNQVTPTFDLGANTTLAVQVTGTLPTVVATGGPGDTINVQATSGALTVQSGTNSTDTIDVGQGIQSLDGIASGVTVTGNGLDTLRVEDENGTGLTPPPGATSSAATLGYYLDGQQVARSESLSYQMSDGTSGVSFAETPLLYSGLASLELDGSNAGAGYTVQGPAAPTTVRGGSSANTFNVQSTAQGAPVTVWAGTGGDTINAGNPADPTQPATTSTLAGIQGLLTVHGRGSSTLNLNDQGTTTDQVYDIWNSHIDWAPAGVAPLPTYINYDGLATLVLNGSSGPSNVLGVVSTAANTTTWVNGDSGNDEFAVGGGDDTLDGILGKLNLKARTGAVNSYVELVDEANRGSHTYVLTSPNPGQNEIDRYPQNSPNTDMGTITYAGQDEEIFYTPQRGGQVIDLESNAGPGPGYTSGIFTQVTTAAGDVVNLGRPNPTPNGSGRLLDQIQFEVAIFSYSGTGSPTINIDDSGDSAFEQATFDTNSYAYYVSGLGLPTTTTANGQPWLYNGQAFQSLIYLPLSGGGTVHVLGGSGGNVFHVNSAPPFALSLDGGTGSNWLNYAGYGSGVTVNLAMQTATGLAGISRIENVVGSRFNDTLTGDASNNILIGLGGNDVLQAGSGRDVLIGGAGNSTLQGGSGQDILIGGWTTYDDWQTVNGVQQYVVNYDALDALLAEWASSDSLSAREQAISSGVGSGSWALNAATVLDNSVSDAIFRNGGTDWIFAGSNDTVS
jgi:Ca2+-binding RTX toxin-like protein